MEKNNQEKKTEVNKFLHNLQKESASYATSLSADTPGLEVTDLGDISYKTLSLQIEPTDSFALLINHFCSQEADCMHSTKYWPYFDQHATLSFTTDPDNPGFVSPREMAVEIVNNFVKLSQIA